MKTIKSLIAVFAIASLSFACSSVTDANFSKDSIFDAPSMDQTSTSDVQSDGLDPDPIVIKPEAANPDN